MRITEDHMRAVCEVYDAAFCQALAGSTRLARRHAGAKARVAVAEHYGVKYARAAAWIAQAFRRVRPQYGPPAPFIEEWIT